MESSQSPLSVDSFSKSWMMNIRPSFKDSLLNNLYDETDGFIELDPKWTPSKRFLSEDADDFSFDCNFASSHEFVVYADELFSNGIFIPFFINPSKMKASDCIAEQPPPAAMSAKESSTGASTPSDGNGKMKWTYLRRYGRSLKRTIFHKYVSFLKVLYQKLPDCSRARKNTVESIDRIWGSSPSREVPPQNSTRCSTTDYVGVGEAILYCKKSFEKEG